MLMCRGLAELASDYVDGELGVGKKLSVRMHILLCRHCRSFVTNLRTSAVLIQAHSSSQVDEALISRIDAEVGRALGTNTSIPPTE